MAQKIPRNSFRQAKEEEPEEYLPPIILPGGIRWTDPEDVMPAFKKPQMTDEEIEETIASHLEVIAGKRKGINFKKYSPPPKSLDHLQHSEVYKLLQEEEPRPRGIAARPEKIPAVQDYYQASQGTP